MDHWLSAEESWPTIKTESFSSFMEIISNTSTHTHTYSIYIPIHRFKFTYSAYLTKSNCEGIMLKEPTLLDDRWDSTFVRDNRNPLFFLYFDWLLCLLHTSILKLSSFLLLLSLFFATSIRWVFLTFYNSLLCGLFYCHQLA